MKKIISFVLGLCMTLSVGAGFTGCDKIEALFGGERDFKNVILVIGDGMGENHILNAIDFYNLETPAFMEDRVAYLNTNSLDGITDSAAGGTALSTGTKVHNSNVAQLDKNDLKQITSIAQEEKMKTGVITTDVLSGATPASFSAHASARTDGTNIRKTQATSGIDLLLGRYTSEYTNRSDLFTDNGYTFVKNEIDLFAAKEAEKLVGVLPLIDSEYISGNEENFQLKEMTQFAVEYLENDNGFFLMIEGAYIDKHSHNNSFDFAMAETRSLIDVIDYLYEYAADGETAVFITADHETGGLMRARDKDDCNGWLYASQDHTATPVPLYVKNYTFKPENLGYKADAEPQNTWVFDACKAIIKGK